MYDLIIVGAGPAGLTAALYAARANKKVLVLESKSYGGQIINSSKIENYPGIEEISGFEFATNLYNQVKKLNVEIKFEEVIKIEKDKKVTTNKNEYSANAIIIATGCKNRKLNIENEDKYIGSGISYCATCDGNFYRDKVVAVIGGGNTALEDAIYLSNISSKVYLINRSDKFKGDEKYLDELKEKDNVEIICNSNVKKILGKDKIEKIEIINDKSKSKKINVSGLFVAIGQIPNNILFNDLIEIDEYGYIKSSDGVHTNIDGIYVAGDVREKYLRQLTTAVSDGALAATIAMEESKS